MSNGSKAHLGKVSYIDKDYGYAFGGFMGLITPTKEVEGHFLHYLLNTPMYKEYIKSLSEGANINNLKYNDLAVFPISYPSISEQQRIVSYLDTAFAQIDALKAKAEKQLSEAKALFQKALAKAMEPKEGWEEKKIIQIADVKGGKRVPKGYKLENINTGYKYIRVSDFTDDGTVDTSQILFISKVVYEQIKNYTITDEDVYISIAGTIGKAGIVSSSLNGANLTENACKLVFKVPVNKRYIYLITKSDSFKEQISKATKQASQPKLALTRLAEVSIPIPPLSDQHRIVTYLDTLSEKVKSLETNLNKVTAECAALKQSILRQVFE